MCAALSHARVRAVRLWNCNAEDDCIIIERNRTDLSCKATLVSLLIYRLIRFCSWFFNISALCCMHANFGLLSSGFNFFRIIFLTVVKSIVSFFYRASLRVSAVLSVCRCLSVCLSVCHARLLYLETISSSNFFLGHIATTF